MRFEPFFIIDDDSGGIKHQFLKKEWQSFNQLNDEPQLVSKVLGIKFICDDPEETEVQRLSKRVDYYKIVSPILRFFPSLDCLDLSEMELKDSDYETMHLGNISILNLRANKLTKVCAFKEIPGVLNIRENPKLKLSTVQLRIGSLILDYFEGIQEKIKSFDLEVRDLFVYVDFYHCPHDDHRYILDEIRSIYDIYNLINTKYIDEPIKYLLGGEKESFIIFNDSERIHSKSDLDFSRTFKPDNVLQENEINVKGSDSTGHLSVFITSKDTYNQTWLRNLIKEQKELKRISISNNEWRKWTAIDSCLDLISKEITPNQIDHVELELYNNSLTDIFNGIAKLEVGGIKTLAVSFKMSHRLSPTNEKVKLRWSDFKTLSDFSKLEEFVFEIGHEIYFDFTQHISIPTLTNLIIISDQIEDVYNRLNQPELNHLRIGNSPNRQKFHLSDQFISFLKGYRKIIDQVDLSLKWPRDQSQFHLFKSAFEAIEQARVKNLTINIESLKDFENGVSSKVEVNYFSRVLQIVFNAKALSKLVIANFKKKVHPEILFEVRINQRDDERYPEVLFKAGYFGRTMPRVSVKWCHIQKSYKDSISIDF